MQDLHGTCTRYVPFLARFLHYLARSCTYLARNGARNSKLAGNYSCSISCKILHHFLQESCKKRDISRARATQVLHARFLHSLARILHDLASLFLLGRSCGGVTGGWVRVCYLDMTDRSHQCPSGFTERSNSNIRTCRRTATSAGCGSVMMDVPYQYSKVCGRVRAYQVGTTNAFEGRSSPNIDSNYVDGVSLTHGSPREHIWTFVAKLQEGSGGHHPSVCSCTDPGAPSSPDFLEMIIFATREHILCHLPHQSNSIF